MLDTEKLPSPELLRQLGPTAEFKPCAWFDLNSNRVVVVTKDCSYGATHITPWFELFIDNGSARGKIIGFSVYCPPSIGLSGSVSVTAILDRIANKTTSYPFRGHLRRMRRRVKGLTVRLA